MIAVNTFDKSFDLLLFAKKRTTQRYLDVILSSGPELSKNINYNPSLNDSANKMQEKTIDATFEDRHFWYTSLFTAKNFIKETYTDKLPQRP